MYTPDCWIIVEVKETKLQKVLAGWSGGYLEGDSWRMSSGITEIDFDEKEYYTITNESGSIYRCYKSNQGLRMSIAGTFHRIEDKVNVIVLGD